MARNLKWYGDEQRKRIEQIVGKRLDAAAIVLVNHVRKMISVEGAGSSGKGKRLIYGANPSHPGEPPHKQTGRLLASIAWERNGMVARVGTNVFYGRILELGGSRMAARPFLHRGLNEMRPRIEAILQKPFDF